MGQYRAVVILLSVIMLGSVFTSSNSFAIHESEELVWQIVMLSSYPACSSYHYQMTQKYNEITSMYLDLYEQVHTNYEPECFPEVDLDYYTKPSDLDLLIIIYDRNMGEEKLHKLEIGGYFSHIGPEWTHNNTIVICDCANFGFSDPVWALSHEISHFLLFYLGYPEEIAEDHIHELDHKYDYCVEKVFEESCDVVKSRIRTEVYSYRYNVMTPYPDAIGKQPLRDENIEQKESILESPIRMDIAKELTTWWNDGVIDDARYSKAMKIIVNRMGFEPRPYTDFYSADSKNMILTDPANDVAAETFHEIQTLDLESKKAKQLFESQPFFEPEIEVTEDNYELGIPTWFKTRADWWLEDKISNYEFLAGVNFMTPDETPFVIQLDPESVPEIEIDIQPGKKAAKINCDEKKATSLGILNDGSINLATIDTENIFVNDSEEPLSIKDVITLKDLNKDGVIDAEIKISQSQLCSFLPSEPIDLNIDSNDKNKELTEITFKIRTQNGVFEGKDKVKVK